jgi:FlaA1/EpsC-like NDP-sugar epimerase
VSELTPEPTTYSGTNPAYRLPSSLTARVLRYSLILALDAFFAVAALYLGLMLRFDGSVTPEWNRTGLITLAVLLPIRTALALLGGLHRWSFRMAGLNEAMRLALITLSGSALFFVCMRAFHWQTAPRSVLALEFFLTTSLMAAYRFAPRLASGWHQDRSRSRRSNSLRTLILGTGNAGDLLFRDLQRSSDHRYHVIGYVDDDPEKRGQYLNGKPVLGDVDLLPRLIVKHHIHIVLIAIEQLEAERVRYILKLCEHLKVNFKIIPWSFAYLHDRMALAMLHDLSPEDLLPREPVKFDAQEAQTLLADRRVLVTGAAGSIGSEIARQVASYSPSKLLLVDVNENELYFLTRRIQEMYPALAVTSLIANIRDSERLVRIGAEHRPQYVFHAAAHKHVPLMEDAPEEAVKNNIFGTLNVAMMADAIGAERFVLISTDKAVVPSSVMGASKRVAEFVVRDLARRSKTKFTAVRFGNVLGSAGSVVPLFKEQIERGGPVTVTHPDCTRYFMTIPEACGLVLLAGLGGYGELCILDMGEPIRIADLASHMITMAGRVPGKDIPIVFTGLRPGEKLNEELLTEEEEQTQVVRDKIKVATSPPPPADFAALLDALRVASEIGDRQAVLGLLQKIVPTFRMGKPIAPAKPATVAPLRIAQSRF